MICGPNGVSLPPLMANRNGPSYYNYEINNDDKIKIDSYNLGYCMERYAPSIQNFIAELKKM